MNMRMRSLFLLVFVAASLALVSPAQAHSEVFERAPALGQVVTGTVDHVDISFWNLVTEGQISVIDPNGDEIAVTATDLATNQRITSVGFEPLTVEGRYTVNHVETAIDGDVQEGTFAFIYNASEGAEVATLFGRDTGPNWPLLGLIFGLVLIVAGFLWPSRTSS